MNETPKVHRRTKSWNCPRNKVRKIGTNKCAHCSSRVNNDDNFGRCCAPLISNGLDLAPRRWLQCRITTSFSLVFQFCWDLLAADRWTDVKQRVDFKKKTWLWITWCPAAASDSSAQFEVSETAHLTQWNGLWCTFTSSRLCPFCAIKQRTARNVFIWIIRRKVVTHSTSHPTTKKLVLSFTSSWSWLRLLYQDNNLILRGEFFRQKYLQVVS